MSAFVNVPLRPLPAIRIHSLPFRRIPALWRISVALVWLCLLGASLPAAAQDPANLKQIPFTHDFSTAGDVFVNGVRYRTPATVTIDVTKPLTVEVEPIAIFSPGRRNEYERMSFWFGQGADKYTLNYDRSTPQVTIADARGLTKVSFSWRREIQVLFSAEGPGRVEGWRSPDNYYYPGYQLHFGAVPDPGAVFNGWKLPHPFASGAQSIDHNFYEPANVVAMFAIPTTPPPPLTVEGPIPRLRYRSSNNVLQGSIRFTAPGRVVPSGFGVDCVPPRPLTELGLAGTETQFDVIIRLAPLSIDLNHVPNGEYQCILSVYRKDGGATVEVPFVVFLGEETTEPEPEPTAAVAEGVVDAASYRALSLAQGSIFSIFGKRLATGIAQAEKLPLPETLATTQVRLTVGGQMRTAPLFYVSPSQVNFLVPLDLPTGGGFLEVVRDGVDGPPRSILVESLAPALFSANADGKGVPAGYAVRVQGETQQRMEIASCPQDSPCVPLPLGSLNPDEDLFLILFGTGFRNRNSQKPEAIVDDLVLPVEFFGPHPEFAGLDQINLRIPRAILGTGPRTLILRHGGKETNGVTIHF